jgi:hypothetical protein
MNVLRLIVAFLFSFCSTAIMSYIAMATPIGPWIETTLVLAAMLIFSFLRTSSFEYSKSLGLTTAAGGIGGILATGVGFSFPTLYFIDKALFKEWLAYPLYFSTLLGALSLAAGSFGLVIAQLFETTFIIQEKLPFPIGELIYKMISAQHQARRALSLAGGFISTTLFLLIQRFTSLLPQLITLVPKERSLGGGISLPALVFSLDMVPMFWAIGFITGHVIAIPLLVGLAAKILCIDSLHYYYESVYTALRQFISFLPTYHQLNVQDFTIAFSSGIVLYSALGGLLELPKMLYAYGKKVTSLRTSTSQWSFEYLKQGWLQLVAVLLVNIAVLSYVQFSFVAQAYLLFFTFICTYQMIFIAGKIGLAPLGRFATFVLVPGLFLFSLNTVQITFIATFVEIAGGVACDALFGRKMAYLASFERKQIAFYQWFGLFISCVSIGILCWLLITTFGLGNEPGALTVNRAVSRALLINCKSFDFFVLGLGFIFGYLLTFTRVSPVLVLGGILMQPTVSLMLISGGLLAMLVKNKEDYYPLWSGVFAANSLWMVIKALIK